MVGVFVDNRVPFALRKGPDVRQLLLDRDVPLARGGIAGIGNSRPGRTGRRNILFQINEPSADTLFQTDQHEQKER